MTRFLSLVLGFGFGLSLLSAAPAPVVFLTAPGRFEIVAVEAGTAQVVTAAADEMWRILAGPLTLPPGFSSPVFVRVVPAHEWSDLAPFRTLVEPGGVVSVRLSWREADRDIVMRRALVQGLLLRLAVSQHGVIDRLTVPLWLEMGCVGWWRTRADAAQWDAARFNAAKHAPPRLEQLMKWQRGAEEPNDFVNGSLGLVAFLQGESVKSAEWLVLLRRLLGGAEPFTALDGSFPGRTATTAERELWWQTGWYHGLQGRVVPTLDAPESRRALEALQRLVVKIDDRERVLSLDEITASRGDPVLASEMEHRLATLNHLLTTLHPFYLNAGVSLRELWSSPMGLKPGDTGRREAFQRDWSAASELEATSRAALDAFEARSKQ